MKKLLKRLQTLNEELDLYKKQQQKYSRLVNDTIVNINKVKNQIDPPPIEFTDHAKIRYIERFTTFNLDSIFASLIDEYKDTIYKAGGNCKLQCGDDYLVIRDFKIITIINKKEINDVT
mgnify:CR=1 FL=1